METKKNILGEQSAKLKSYEPSSSIDTYYGDYDEALTTALLAKANERATGDDVKTTVVDFLINEEGIIERIITPKEVKTKEHASQILNQ